MTTDHNALIGPWPFRALPSPTAAQLIAELDRLGVAHAWVGHVPSITYRDVPAGNDELFAALRDFAIRLLPVPAVNPVWPAWEREIARARGEGAPAVRTWPAHYGFSTAAAPMRELAAACAEASLALVLTTRIEDPRQKSRLDVAPELIGADLRNALRAHDAVQLLVCNADRAIVEEVHWGSSAAEAARIRWDISHIWGPPEDHLAHLVRTVGRDRFVFGSFFPFRGIEGARARMELLGGGGIGG
jgi:hypothetical protein